MYVYFFPQKKVSIPGTVSRALKYIPELQKEVETLIRKKENLLLCSYSRNINGTLHVDIKDQSANEAMIQAKSTIVSSVNVLHEKEVVIQLISSTNHISKNKEFGFLSMVLEYLEGEDGLLLINATTFNCFGDRRLNTLHLQVYIRSFLVQVTNNVVVKLLMRKILSLRQ